MSAAEYRTAANAWRGCVSAVLLVGEKIGGADAPTSPGAGRPSRELTATAFALRDVRERVASSASRPLNAAFPVGAFLHVLAGREDVEMIEYYNPLAPRFSDDGKTLFGSYGPAVAAAIPRLVALLRSGGSTRRAVLPIFAERHLLGDSRDLPCPLAVQFLARGGALDAVATFRSQNAYSLLPYDLFLFTMLHEHVAAQAGLVPGRYVQVTGSMHVYEDEAGVAADAAADARPGLPMPTMTPLAPGALAAVMRAEAALRAYGLGAPGSSACDTSEFDPYWRGVVNLLAAFADARRAGLRHLRDPRAVEAAFSCCR